MKKRYVWESVDNGPSLVQKQKGVCSCVSLCTPACTDTAQVREKQACGDAAPPGIGGECEGDDLLAARSLV